MHQWATHRLSWCSERWLGLVISSSIARHRAVIWQVWVVRSGWHCVVDGRHGEWVVGHLRVWNCAIRGNLDENQRDGQGAKEERLTLEDMS